MRSVPLTVSVPVGGWTTGGGGGDDPPHVIRVELASAISDRRTSSRILDMRVPAIGLVVLTLAANLHAQLRPRVQASGFSTPLAFVQDPTDRATQFVVQQDGHVRVLRGATVLPRDFLDVSGSIVAGGEQGLLGL